MAAQFNTEQFLLKPTEDSLFRLKKTDLITLATDLKITQIKAGGRKVDIRQAISQYMYEPAREDLCRFKKSDLFTLALYLGLSQVTAAYSKSEIYEAIMQVFFDERSVPLPIHVVYGTGVQRIERLKLSITFRQMRKQAEIKRADLEIAWLKSDIES